IPAHDSAVHSLTFSPDGSMLASTGWADKTIAVWDPALGTKLFDLACGSNNSAVAFSPDGKTLAWGGGWPEQGVALWEPRPKRQGHNFAAHAAFVHALASAPDSKSLVSGSMDSTGIVWDLTGLRTGTARPAPASADALRDLWKTLASPDATQAG